MENSQLLTAYKIKILENFLNKI